MSLAEPKSSDPSSSQRRWRSAPFIALNDLVGSGPILVLSPHPDDETIGCGGLILQTRRENIAVYVDILTDGSISHPNSRLFPPTALASLRQEECRAACTSLGVEADALEFWALKDGALQCTEAAIQRMVARLDAIRPTVVFATWIDDPHGDHKATFDIARAAIARSATGTRLFGYPIWSWRVHTEHHKLEAAVFRLDMMSDIDFKRRAFECHASQLGRVVLDDPNGCNFSPGFLARLYTMYETFIEVRSVKDNEAECTER